MNFEIYTKLLSAINQKKLLMLDSKTSIIFQKKFNDSEIKKKNLRMENQQNQ